MRNIEQILAEVEGLTDEQKSSITKGVTENYRSIEEVNKKTDRIAELEGKVTEYEESIAKLEGDSEQLEALKSQVSEYEEAEKKRQEDEAEADKLAKFTKTFDEAIKNRSTEQGNSFANDMMRDSVLEKVRKLCAEDESKGIAEAIDAVTKDVSGVWKNPQQPIHNMPTGKDSSGTDKVESQKSALHNFMKGL